MPENPSLHQEIQQLEQALSEKRAALEQSSASGAQMPAEKELVHQVIGEKIQQHLSTSTSAVPAKTDDQATPLPVGSIPPPSGGAQPSYFDPQLQPRVQNLVNIAFTRSFAEAVKEAVKTNNAALIDAFHDLIADKMYEELLARQKITKP